jgi:hypothetical protein
MMEKAGSATGAFLARFRVVSASTKSLIQADTKGNASGKSFYDQVPGRACCREGCGIQDTAIEKDAPLGCLGYHRLLAGDRFGFAVLRQ